MCNDNNIICTLILVSSVHPFRQHALSPLCPRNHAQLFQLFNVRRRRPHDDMSCRVAGRDRDDDDGSRARSL